MVNKENRRYPRIESLNLIAYECMDMNGNMISQGMGRTLNVSEAGMLMETYHPLESEEIVLVDVGIKDELINIRGRIVHKSLNKIGRNESGIEFIDIDNRSVEILRKYIEAFYNLLD